MSSKFYRNYRVNTSEILEEMFPRDSMRSDVAIIIIIISIFLHDALITNCTLGVPEKKHFQNIQSIL